jgi:hypothetical protein
MDAKLEPFPAPSGSAGCMLFSMDSRRQDLLTFFAGLEQAFGFFGGVPYELRG